MRTESTGRPGSEKAEAAFLPADGALRGMSLGIALGALLGVTYAVTGLGIPCPFKLATGLDCPACGGTRMAASLFEGDPVAALRYNGPLLIVCLAFGYLWLAWVLARMGVIRLPRPRLAARTRRRIAYGLIVGALIFTIVRNLI